MTSSESIADIPRAARDDIEAHIATFTEDERRELAAADAAIELAILLYRARERRGLSQAAAARLAGKQQQAVSRLERPGANPQWGTVLAYLDALGFGLELKVIDLGTDETAATVTMSGSRRTSA